ncbi:extensin [Iris pallida]|uniref:Extensin n=1 Tax=Iris pallida TaxID=29817 RepID=A0AAX6HK62_IRIPA|nr:extensin [Iris pallida]
MPSPGSGSHSRGHRCPAEDDGPPLRRGRVSPHGRRVADSWPSTDSQLPATAAVLSADHHAVTSKDRRPPPLDHRRISAHFLKSSP